MNILSINASSRSNSNTEFMIDRLFKGVSHKQIMLNQYLIHPIEDQRHSNRSWVFPDDDYLKVLNILLESDVIVFSTPIYWYGISGLLKNFIDRWSESLATMPNFRQKMKNKSVYLMLVGGDEPNIKGLPIVQQFQYICQFLDLKLVDYVIGTGNRPLDVQNDQLAINKIDSLNKKLLGGNELEK